jgi:hypothetical protein
MRKKELTYLSVEIEIADYIYANPQYKSAEVVALFCEKLRKRKRTVQSYLAKAKIYNRIRQDNEEKVRNGELERLAKEKVKKAILTREEAEEILTRIAKGVTVFIPKGYEMQDGKPVTTEFKYETPSNSDRIMAVTKLATMNGWDAATKSELIGTIKIGFDE